MFHPPSGVYGLLVGVVVFAAIWLVTYFTRQAGPFHLDPGGKLGAFEPFLAKYLRVGEFIVGLAAGSIVLLIGSSALHNPTGSLPAYCASPLFLLGCCVLFGIAFMVWLIFHYEDYQHGAQHTRKAYALSLTQGFSSLACFVIGYGWLIFKVTR